MPEGDTVWLAGRSLNTALWGRVLTRTDFRIPQLAAIDLSGRSVIEVVSRGKHLLTRIEGGTTLHTHFRMDGLAHLRSRSPLGGRISLNGKDRGPIKSGDSLVLDAESQLSVNGEKR